MENNKQTGSILTCLEKTFPSQTCMLERQTILSGYTIILSTKLFLQSRVLKASFTVFLALYMQIILASYLVLGYSYRSGWTVGTVVQVPVVGCIMVHTERQNETPWEDSAQGVIHLMGKYEHLFSLSKPTTAQFDQKQRKCSTYSLLDLCWEKQCKHEM